MRLQVFVRIFVWLAIAPILMVSCANQVPIVDTSSLYASAIGDIQLEVSAQGTVQRVWGELLSPTTQAEFRYDPYAAAVRFYRNHALAFGVNSSTEFSLRTSYPSREGGVVVRLEQSHQGLPVLNTDALLHFGPSGIVRDLAIRFDAEVEPKAVA